MMMAIGITISLDQFRIGQNHLEIISFEGFRGFIDMLRFAGQMSVDYDGGDTFTLNVNSLAATDIIARFESFGIKAEAKS